MQKTILTIHLLAAVSTAQAAVVNLTDNSFESVTYQSFIQGAVGPIISFSEKVSGVTFNFATTGQFRKVGTWGNGTSQINPPWALQFGGGGGNPGTFTLSVDTDIKLNRFTGLGQQFNTSTIFDVTGTGVSSPGNAFSLSGFLGSDAPVVESFVGGPLSLTAGTIYTFEASNAGAATNGFITALDFSPVPVPAAVWLLGSGLLSLITIAKRKRV